MFVFHFRLRIISKIALDLTKSTIILLIQNPKNKNSYRLLLHWQATTDSCFRTRMAMLLTNGTSVLNHKSFWQFANRFEYRTGGYKKSTVRLFVQIFVRRNRNAQASYSCEPVRGVVGTNLIIARSYPYSNGRLHCTCQREMYSDAQMPIFALGFVLIYLNSPRCRTALVATCAL